MNKPSTSIRKVTISGSPKGLTRNAMALQLRAYGSISTCFPETLHPIQFAELCAQFFYKSSLFLRSPLYIIACDKNIDPQMIINHQISGHAYSDWDNEKYAYCLATLLSNRGIRYEDLYIKEKGVRAFILDNEGNFDNIVESLKKNDGGYYDVKFEFE